MNVVYQAPEIIQWLELEAKRASTSGKEKSIAASSKDDLVETVKQYASAALSYGKGAVAGLVQKQAEEVRYELFETGFEFIDIARRIKIDYSEVRKITSKSNDRVQVLYSGGSITIKPVAHLVSGKYKVPIGWKRNNVEVPYVMLVEELAARCGLEIEAE